MPEPEKNEETLKQITACCRALDDKKARDLKILDLRGKSSITDYFIIASGTSDTQLKALQGGLRATLKDMDVDIVGVDSEPDSGWVVVDAFDFMVHLFLPEIRERYGLETLWKDAEEIEVEGLVGV